MPSGVPIVVRTIWLHRWSRLQQAAQTFLRPSALGDTTTPLPLEQPWFIMGNQISYLLDLGTPKDQSDVFLRRGKPVR